MARDPACGSCLCGAISFSVHAEPNKILACYCMDCVKNAGASHQVVSSLSNLHYEVELLLKADTDGRLRNQQCCIERPKSPTQGLYY